MLLHLNNHLVDTRSIFIGIQRARFPSREEIGRLLCSGETLAIPVRFIGQWEILIAIVRKMTALPEGTFLHINPNYRSSVLQNWSNALIWIPASKLEMAGVLNYYPEPH